MADDEQQKICLKFLHSLRAAGKAVVGFEESVSLLQKYTAQRGLENDEIQLLANIVIRADLSATKLVPLIQCLIPKYKMPEKTVKQIMIWFLSSSNKLPITVCITIVQWIIGILDYQLVDRKVVNMYYDIFFYVMLKRERLEKHLAWLIYLITEPDDITRRQVYRLTTHMQQSSRSQNHITALLSLFKSCKPEVVPEKIQSVNVESVWKPIPDVLRLSLTAAKDRADIQQTEDSDPKHFKWNTLSVGRVRKAAKPLLPSAGYFQISSSIFKGKDTKSIFDISSIEELGKLHLMVELPCNALSLLANDAGYHLLTYADFHYQSRFSYNLYNTLIRAFVLENEKFSEEEISKLLNMTVEFSRYMQQGIPVVNHFFREYLHFNTGEYQSKLLGLLEWMTSISVTEVERNLATHIQDMYYESSLSMKCEIIRSLGNLITNLFVNQASKNSFPQTEAPFLGQRPIDNLEDVLSVLVKMSNRLIVSGLNIHSYNLLLLSEALFFYEVISLLEDDANMLSLTLAPSAVIYGCFITKSCNILSRVCKLLMRYHLTCKRFMQLGNRNLFRNKMYILSVYIQDIAGALWYSESFERRDRDCFLKHFPQRLMKDVEHCKLDSMLSISNHYAVLPYKITLSKMGLNISNKQDDMSVALHYYPDVHEFLSVFQE